MCGGAGGAPDAIKKVANAYGCDRPGEGRRGDLAKEFAQSIERTRRNGSDAPYTATKRIATSSRGELVEQNKDTKAGRQGVGMGKTLVW